MWTDKNRAKYNRDHLRYPSDLTDEEWAHIEPLIPPAKSGGGKQRTDMRAVMDGVMYILSTGCQWRYIPNDFPPRSSQKTIRRQRLCGPHFRHGARQNLAQPQSMPLGACRTMQGNHWLFSDSRTPGHWRSAH